MLITDAINNVTTFDFQVFQNNIGWFNTTLAYPNYSVNITMDYDINGYGIGDAYTRANNYIETWLFDPIVEA